MRRKGGGLEGSSQRGRAGGRKLHVALMLAPILLVLGGLSLLSLLMALLQSFGYAPLYSINEFPTLQPYRQLFSLAGFWRSLGLTLFYALVPTLIGTVMGVYLALLLRERFSGRGMVRYIYKLPLVVPYLVGVALVTLLFSNGGIVARFLYALGLIERTGSFPRILYTHAGWGVMLVYLWKQVPFTTLIVYTALLGLGRDYEEAAATLGANPRQRFWHVTLPQILPAIVSASVIVFAFNLGSFEVPFILGGGFPNTLPVEAWRAFDDPDLRNRLRAMAIIMFLTALAGVILLGYGLLYRSLLPSRDTP